MIVHSTVPGNAPNADPVAEIDRNLKSDNSSADFSALLFLILATPQVQPVGPQGSDVQVSEGSADSCAQGLCGAVVPVIPGQVDPQGANILANGATAQENHAAGLPASAVNVDVVAGVVVALPIESATPVATAGQFQPIADEAFPLWAQPSWQIISRLIKRLIGAPRRADLISLHSSQRTSQHGAGGDSWAIRTLCRRSFHFLGHSRPVK